MPCRFPSQLRRVGTGRILIEPRRDEQGLLLLDSSKACPPCVGNSPGDCRGEWELISKAQTLGIGLLKRLRVTPRACAAGGARTPFGSPRELHVNWWRDRKFRHALGEWLG